MKNSVQLKISPLTATRTPVTRPAARTAAWGALLSMSCALPSAAQDSIQIPPAGEAAALSSVSTTASPARVAQAANLIGEAITIAEANWEARPVVVRGAASLIPQLTGESRDRLTQRWLRLLNSGAVSRDERLQLVSAFYGSTSDVEYGRTLALTLPDAAARAGAFLSLSRQVGESDWSRANDLALLAQRAARQEEDDFLRARALTFVALRLADLNPELREEAVVEASTAVRRLPASQSREELLAENVGAAAKFDLGLARRMAADIGNERIRSTASARVNISEISQSTLTGSNSDRIAQLARAAAPYDVRAIPVLLNLPPQQETLKALGDALPPIYPSARPTISPELLERMWTYASAAEPSVYRDQLQSRLARLMVLHDLWRGRAWGKQLAWQGGRVQVGAFLNDVIEARRSTLSARPAQVTNLQDVAAQNLNRAIAQARTLPPAARAESLLLIAAQILG